MSRSASSSFKTAAAAGTLYPALLAYLDFSSGAVRLWSGIGDLVWSGDTYTGVGDLGGVSPVQETSDVRANGVEFTLKGIPSAMIARILGDDYRGHACKLWFALFDPSTHAVIADPLLMFSGRMDQCRLADDGKDATIVIAAESRLVDLQRPRERRYTDEEQNNLFSGDRGLEYVTGLQDKEILWGGGSSGTNAATSASAGSAAGSVQKYVQP